MNDRPGRLNGEQIASLMSKKIFFGHQSVGNNIVQGIKDMADADPRLTLNIVKSPDPQLVPAPAFVEFEIGENCNPHSKIDAFTAILDKGLGAQGGVAMLKFCYVDIDSSTDIPKLFAAYSDAVGNLTARYPSVKIVHITVPLTTVEPPARAWIKRLAGKVTLRDINGKRNQFNSLLRQAYAGTEPIFDLEEIESTRIDGSREYFSRGDQTIFTLAPEFTADGGHLNDLGRRVAAERMLFTLGQL